ncbi:L-dopachrome tautomerase yellow-f-like [Ostrinia nubilalis]|uniref:L-dopachrome tautomerase yellow-f-like n=1 Tax=Ostrinia nubilalis TaxID=29057 RepID=UPI003082409C
MKPFLFIAIIICFIQKAITLIPPKFQWKLIDYAWEGDFKDTALAMGAYIPENNMPTGLARWKDKLFITVPRWKRGVPSSLNYVYLNGSQQEPLIPYPTWRDAFVTDDACHPSTNATVVSTFRVHIDRCDRLWVIDNGVADMSNAVRQISDPAVLVFDLKTDTLLRRYDLGPDVLKDSSVLSSIVVDIPGKHCDDAYAYITDMGSNALIVYGLKAHEAWRVENHYFHFDPHAGVYKVGGVDFYWSDGVSSAALSHTKSDGYRDLYLHPTSSTKQFKMSTKLLRHKDAPREDVFNGVEIIGDRGPMSQASACDYDQKNNILFYTQLCKNAIGCWNVDRPFIPENTLILMKDCNMLEFPNDVKVDQEGNLWILSDRQSRFLYDSMNFSQVNFRVLTAPVTSLVQGTPCERMSMLGRALSALSFKKASKTKPAPDLKPLKSNDPRSASCCSQMMDKDNKEMKAADEKTDSCCSQENKDNKDA